MIKDNKFISKIRLDGTETGSPCVQAFEYMYDWVPIETDKPGNEDCLYMNIFVPKSALQKNIALPLYLYFHGGAFLGNRSITT